MDIPMIDIEATGANIRRLRKERGIKVKDVQDILGMANPTSIYIWENGRSIPSIDNLVILARILNVKLDDIVAIKE